MAYRIYVNHTHSRVTIHKGSCQYARRRRQLKTPNGEWPQYVFSDIRKAYQYANALKKKTVAYCAKCC